MKKVSSGISPVIAVDRKAAKPLHRQIYDAYRAMIIGRSLRVGQQIPSPRALASELGISRIPVLSAHSQILAEGYFEARVGAGTFVCSALPEQLISNEGGATHSPAAPCTSRPMAKRVSALPRFETLPWLLGSGAFSVSQPAYEQFPFQLWSTLIMRHSRNPQTSSLRYGSVMGSKDLREAI